MRPSAVICALEEIGGGGGVRLSLGKVGAHGLNGDPDPVFLGAETCPSFPLLRLSRSHAKNWLLKAARNVVQSQKNL